MTRDPSPNSPRPTPGPPWASILAGTFVVLALVILVVDIHSRSEDARTEGMDHLISEAQERGGELEGLFAQADRALSGAATVAGEAGPGRLEELARQVKEALAPRDTLLGGIAFLDTAGVVVRSHPPGLADRIPELGTAEPTVTPIHGNTASFWGGYILADTLPVITITRSVIHGDDDIAGFLSLVVEVTPTSENWPDPDQSIRNPTFFLLDSLGYILSHPERGWIGHLLISEADTTYDPELWRVFPEILRPGPGVWSLVSQILAPGAWAHGLRSLLVSAPLRLPNGSLWHVVLTASENPGPLPGISPVIRVGSPAAVLSALLLGAALLLVLPALFRFSAGQASGEDGWYRTLVEAGPDGLVLITGKGKIVTANEAFADMVGTTPEELEGAALSGLLEHPDSEDGESTARLPEEGWTEARLRRLNGTHLDVELHTAKLSLRSEVFRLSLVRDLTRRRQVERETLRVGEKERLLLGMELHDGLGQHLTGVAFMAKTLAARLVDARDPGAEDAVRISQLVKDAVGQIRVLSRGLELTEYEARELPEALAEMAGVVRRLMGVELEVDLDLDGPDKGEGIDTFLTTQLYRLCHEVVSDAVRNRLAQRVRVRIRRDGPRVLMTVRHDGSSPRTTQSSLSDFRLRYRARLLDAAVEVSDGETGETVITCSFETEGARA